MKINELLAKANEKIKETITAGSIATVANPGAIKSKKRGKIAKNALDSNDSLFGGKTVRR